MKTICLTTSIPYESVWQPGLMRSRDRAHAHFVERGLEADFFYGIDAPRAGIVATAPFDENTSSVMDTRRLGNWLSQRALWAACLLLPDDRFFLLEDDANFPEDWRPRVEQAMVDAGDFDLLYVGSCCTTDKPKEHVRGQVWEVRYPMCMHAYVVNGHRVLRRLISTQDAVKAHTHMDISTYFYSLPTMRALTVLPRIVGQVDLPGLPE